MAPWRNSKTITSISLLPVSPLGLLAMLGGRKWRPVRCWPRRMIDVRLTQPSLEILSNVADGYAIRTVVDHSLFGLFYMALTVTFFDWGSLMAKRVWFSMCCK